MSSFSIRKAMNPETLASFLGSVTLGDVYKDYRKETFPVRWEKKYLSLKIPELTILQTPKDGDKFIYARFSNDEVCNSRKFLNELDHHLASQFPDTEEVKPAFGKVIKLYLPYKEGRISYRKFHIYDSDKNEVEIQELKENSRIKALACLSQYKRYCDEIIPVWCLGLIQMIKEEATPAAAEAAADEIVEPPEEEEINQEQAQHHSILESRPKILLEDPEDSDFSEGEFDSL